jgi:hypothetical protein
MLFEVHAPVGKDSQENSSNTVTKCYKYMVSAIIMSHGQEYSSGKRGMTKDTCTRCVLKRMIWKKIRIVYSMCHSCSGGWLIEVSTKLVDRMMGIQWKMRNYDKLLLEQVILNLFYRGSCK